MRAWLPRAAWRATTYREIDRPDGGDDRARTAATASCASDLPILRSRSGSLTELLVLVVALDDLVLSSATIWLFLESDRVDRLRAQREPRGQQAGEESEQGGAAEDAGEQPWLDVRDV